MGYVRHTLLTGGYGAAVACSTIPSYGGQDRTATMLAATGIRRSNYAPPLRSSADDE
jgi:hypothetical protein